MALAAARNIPVQKNHSVGISQYKQWDIAVQTNSVGRDIPVPTNSVCRDNAVQKKNQSVGIFQYKQIQSVGIPQYKNSVGRDIPVQKKSLGKDIAVQTNSVGRDIAVQTNSVGRDIPVQTNSVGRDIPRIPVPARTGQTFELGGFEDEKVHDVPQPVDVFEAKDERRRVYCSTKCSVRRNILLRNIQSVGIS